VEAPTGSSFLSTWLCFDWLVGFLSDACRRQRRCTRRSFPPRIPAAKTPGRCWRACSGACWQIRFQQPIADELAASVAVSSSYFCPPQALESVHAAFFAAADPAAQDARTVLAGVRRRVLAGCRVVFSGVFPRTAVPQNDYHWRLAEKVGSLLWMPCLRISLLRHGPASATASMQASVSSPADALAGCRIRGPYPKPYNPLKGIQTHSTVGMGSLLGTAECGCGSLEPKTSPSRCMQSLRLPL